MKKALFYLAIASISFLACSKNDGNGPSPSPSPKIESTTVFYADTFRIYSTDLKGGNRKLVVDEGINSGNNYVGRLTYVPKANKLVYTYYEHYTLPIKMMSCNLDGTDKKVIKTFAKDDQLGLIKGTADGSIFYQLNVPVGGLMNTRTFSMKADGTGETELKVGFYSYGLTQEQISTDGNGILGDDGYYMKLVNGVFDERNSFNLFLNEDRTKLSYPVQSADGSKVAFVSSTSTSRKYEIRIKDAVKDSPTSKVLYSVTIPSEVRDQTPSIRFANGNKSILINYGKFTTPKGSPNDYTQCELIDVATGTAINWKFTGDNIGNIITN